MTDIAKHYCHTISYFHKALMTDETAYRICDVYGTGALTEHVAKK